MAPLSFQEPKTKQDEIDLALEEWHKETGPLYNALPEKSPARTHVNAFLCGIAEFKLRVYLILKRYEEYERNKENGIEEEPTVRREYQG